MTGYTWNPHDADVVRGLRDGAGAVAEADAYARAVWSCLVEPGDGVAGGVIAVRGAGPALRDVMRDAQGDVAAATGLAADDVHDAFARWRPRLQRQTISFALELASRSDVRLVVPGDACWPVALDDLGVHAPVCLWVRGEVVALTGTAASVALVGARAASGYGEHVATELSAELSARGVTVVSGAAYGIDGAAHRAALAEDGTTVALLAGGVDRPYPAGHADLLRRIALHGAVASEMPCGAAPTKWRFLQRNRTIAALSAATVVVEAGRRSGSLNTAGHASQLGRPLGAVPGPVTSTTSAGCHRLLREYDAQCITCADDVLELLGMGTTAEGVAGAAADAPPAEHTRVADALSARVWRPVPDIARRAGLSTSDVAAALGTMLLDGAVHTDGTGWRRASTRS